ncbi:MAG TPA: ABC transporter ATP-binding protein [Cryomorphaceae bacterium]|jgi:phospholipid/cholesterol/gamma-HCH transport system ATP-binding protein|nr:ABC transporter ATP-binding protein [Cryomorphaceae bacterium]HBJ71388.1 ABC transporter ATP-binding protein [Cryomorphaceae bacterium]
MIQVRGIHKSFGEQHVLRGIDVDFHEGQCNLIIGLSGSGKTVFLKSVLGLHALDQGTISFDGRVLGEMGKKEVKALRQEMGMVFQGSALFNSLTIAENVRLPLDFFASMTEAEKDERVRFCLERVRIEPDSFSKTPAELSGGMQKRVAIARAIVLNPKYLFCDEPNSGLDPETAIVIDQLIHEITHEFGMTTVINTHDMNSVLEIGDHVILMENGIKAWEGTMEEVLDSDDSAVVDYVFRSNLFKKLRAALKKA